MNNIIRIYICLAIITVIACCTKYEQKEIAFSPLAQKATKTIMTSTTYDDEGFVVTAYRNASQLYFSNAKVEKSGDDWKSSNLTCYWPMSGSLGFSAYSPYSAAAKGLTAAQNKVTCANYSIENAADMGTDLCYATATRSDCATDKSPVDIVFHHALSYITVNVTSTDTGTSNGSNGMLNTVTITVNSVELQNIKSTGTFDSSASSHWSAQANPATYNITAPNGESGVGFLMIPQDLGSNAAIKVEYTITQTVTKNGDEVRTITTNHEGIAAIGTNPASWDENKKITYDLTLSPLHPMTFSAVYGQDWMPQPDYTFQF